MDSKLQIISGRYRGRKLHLPSGARPTQNRARIALFNMLGAIVDTTHKFTVWDAFAGSGAFGLEFLSRSPNARVIFTDVATASIRAIRANLDGMDGANATVVTADALTRVSEFGATSDLIFVDPPYLAHDTGVAFVRRVAAVARPGTILVWEQDGDNFVAPGPEWEILRDKKYGRARFLVLQRCVQ